MKLALVLLSAAVAWGQVPSGEALFTKSCGSGYCHNGRGVGGGAPRLAAREFTADFIRTTVTNGVKGTSMPAFGASLSRAELNAVVGYVAGLNGVTATGAAKGAVAVKLTAAQQKGQDLFKDATRSFGRCSTCHLVGGFGIAVTAPIHAVPMTVAAMKALKTPNIVTATVLGDIMPALVLANKTTEVRFYDLTQPPPVLRTVAPGNFIARDGSDWSHAKVIGTYTDAELASILVYLRAAVH